MSRAPDILIIGGGVTDAAAYEIARAGHSVTLLAKRRLAAMASGWTLGGSALSLWRSGAKPDS